MKVAEPKALLDRASPDADVRILSESDEWERICSARIELPTEDDSTEYFILDYEL